MGLRGEQLTRPTRKGDSADWDTHTGTLDYQEEEGIGQQETEPGMVLCIVGCESQNPPWVHNPRFTDFSKVNT